MNCVPEEIKQCQAGECAVVVRCKSCLRPMSPKYPNAKRLCGAYDPAIHLPPETLALVEREAGSRGILLGDAVAALTKAIGIPPCGGCDKRRQWLNTAHAWIASYFSPKS